MPRRLVIVPTFNERENIIPLVNQILASLPGVEFLLVDDGSPDGTADMVESQFPDEPRVHILRRQGQRGLGRSYVDGYGWAVEHEFDHIVQMDADFSHNPTYLPAIFADAETADVVIGSRYCAGGGVEDWPARRLWLSQFANWYVAAVTGLKVKDSTAGFRCYTRRALERIDVDSIASNGYAFQVEMTFRASRAGLVIRESPIIFTDRRLGKSKISRTVLLESMIMPWKLRVRKAKSGPKAEKRKAETHTGP